MFDPFVFQRISVIMGGIVIFGLWMKYRTVQNIWPLQLLMMGCVGIVPIRYAPLNCILKVDTAHYTTHF